MTENAQGLVGIGKLVLAFANVNRVTYHIAEEKYGAESPELITLMDELIRQVKKATYGE